MARLGSRPAGWVAAPLASHCFNVYVWHRFSNAFWHGFGIILGPTFDHLSIILPLIFGSSTLDGFGSNFHGKLEPLNHGKFNYYVVRFEKSEKSQVPNFNTFCIRLYIDFCIICLSFYIFVGTFVASNFVCIFGCVFTWILAPKWHPGGFQNRPKNFKKLKNVVSRTG